MEIAVTITVKIIEMILLRVLRSKIKLIPEPIILAAATLDSQNGGHRKDDHQDARQVIEGKVDQPK